ncbi:hypothetical protein [Nocardia sp. NPDC020380]|uniref:hypothetical protein n=1 Tax=Nocardia sp. NPDC020380 TaxID=3364309 RepID=UPI00379C90CF
MPPAATQATVRAQLLRHFTATLQALPAGTALVLRHPDLPRAALHNGITLPWNASDPDDALEFFDIRYWMLGATPDSSDAYFDLVLRGWDEKGWATRTDREARPRTGYAETPDGYGLTLTQSVNGYLSMAGTTPPFPADSEAGSALPARVG